MGKNKVNLWQHSDFTGRNLMPILDGVLGLLEETDVDGRSVKDVLGDDIKGKKEWRVHVARVKALPKDFQIVYKEIQKYLFKVGPVELTDGIDLLSGIIDLFEESVAFGKGIIEVTGSDVAAFCDNLIKDSKTYADIYKESVDQEVNKVMKKVTDKTK